MSKRRKVEIDLPPSAPSPASRVSEEAEARIARAPGFARPSRLKSPVRGVRITAYLPGELYDAVRLLATLERRSVTDLLTEAAAALVEARSGERGRGNTFPGAHVPRATKTPGGAS